MFACRWFEVAVLVSSVAKTAHTSVRQEVPSRDISQVDVELILNAQTSLRRHFIGSLAEVKDRVTEVEGFDAVVGGIIQDLQTRNLDPFKLVRYASSSEKPSSPTSLIAEIIHNLQGPTIADWSSLLPTSGRFELLQKIQQLDEPFVDFVLRGIHNHSIKLNSKLLADVLYNFRFRQYSPELVVILESVKQTFFENVENLSDFQTDAAVVKPPGDVLSDILEFISRKKQSNTRLVYIDQLLSALSDRGNAIQVKNTWELFDLMLQDDYPPDIIQAKNTLSLAVRDNNTGVDLSGVDETIKGNPPMEKLLMLMAKLSGSSLFRREVQAVHPHIKLRYLTSKGQFFRPRTVLDVTFLLNSFLTVRDEMIPVLEEVRRIFILSDWEEVLKNFDFARYSKPRPLVVDMIRGLLNESSKLPLCSRIILRYFLSTNRENCNGDGFREELTGSWVIRSVQDSHSLTPTPHLQVKTSVGSEWEASQLPPKWFSATADPSPSAFSTISPSLNSQLTPDSEYKLPSSQLSVYSSVTGTSTTPMLPVSQPSASTASSTSPTTFPPKTSPSPALYTSLESSTSAYSQFLPLRRVDNTTPINSVDQGSSSTTTIQEQSSTTDPYSMVQDETTLESRQEEKTWRSGVELTSDEPSETTSVDEGESTPPGLLY